MRTEPEGKERQGSLLAEFLHVFRVANFGTLRVLLTLTLRPRSIYPAHRIVLRPCRSYAENFVLFIPPFALRASKYVIIIGISG